MIDKSSVEKYLKANGVSSSAPDEEIKSVLFSAKWHSDDVETALMVLKENTQTHEKRVDSLHKVFRSDERLKPETISSLLGIDVEVPPPRDANHHVKSGLGAREVFYIGFFSLLLATIFVFFGMWHLKMGLFYATV